MATIKPSFTAQQGMTSLDGYGAGWQGMANGDVGESIDKFGGFADKSMQVEGTFGAGGTVIAEGSNDGVNFRTLNDPQGNPISMTAAGIKTILESVLHVRPRVTAGDGTTSLSVTMFARKTP
jgi:hypothetical protein